MREKVFISHEMIIGTCLCFYGSWQQLGTYARAPQNCPVRGLALTVSLHYFALLFLRCDIRHPGVKEKGVT